MTTLAEQPPAPPNPYATPRFAEPRHSPDAVVRTDVDVDVDIASPWLRLLARIVDNVLQLGWLAVFAFEHPLVRSEGELGPIGLLVPLPCLAVTIVQAVLIARTGASIGKRIFGLKIVRHDGSEVGFLHGWVVRSLVYGAAESVANTFFLYLPAVVDALFIFTRNGQTLHDRVASTYVIRAR